MKAITSFGNSAEAGSKPFTHRIHFLEGLGLRRQRAIALAGYAPAVSRQTSGRGRVLISVGVRKDQVRLYERLVEAIGDLAMSDFSAAGFDVGHVMRPEGIPQGQSWTANPLDPSLPIARIWEDNERSRGYGLHARLGEVGSLRLPCSIWSARYGRQRFINGDQHF